MQQTMIGTSLAALAAQAHERHEQMERAEHKRRTEARARELADAAEAHVRATLADVPLAGAVEVEHVHAEPFDQFGGFVRLNVDGVPMLFDYTGPEQPPRLSVVTTCPECGQETSGADFDGLASLGAALARPEFIDPERHCCFGTSTAD